MVMQDPKWEREDTTGKSIAGKGRDISNALMKMEKRKTAATWALSGWFDETEIETIPTGSLRFIDAIPETPPYSELASRSMPAAATSASPNA